MGKSSAPEKGGAQEMVIRLLEVGRLLHDIRKQDAEQNAASVPKQVRSSVKENIDHGRRSTQ